jgi:hypothetical protein
MFVLELDPKIIQRHALADQQGSVGVGGESHALRRVVLEVEQDHTGQRTAIRVDQQVQIRRGDVDDARFQPVAFSRHAHFQRRPPAQDLDHQAAMARVQVLDNDHCCREVRRQRSQHFAHRAQPTRRCHQADYVKCRTGEVSRSLACHLPFRPPSPDAFVFSRPINISIT